MTKVLILGNLLGQVLCVVKGGERVVGLRQEEWLVILKKANGGRVKAMLQTTEKEPTQKTLTLSSLTFL